MGTYLVFPACAVSFLYKYTFRFLLSFNFSADWHEVGISGIPLELTSFRMIAHHGCISFLNEISHCLFNTVASLTALTPFLLWGSSYRNARHFDGIRRVHGSVHSLSMYFPLLFTNDIIHWPMFKATTLSDNSNLLLSNFYDLFLYLKNSLNIVFFVSNCSVFHGS